nr:hypothetical protein [Tanacetum cinerariifolium]
MSTTGSGISEVKSAVQTLLENVVTQEIEKINTTLVEPTTEEPKEETTTANAPPSHAENTIAKIEVETIEVSEEPKEETLIMEEAHTT